MHIELGRLRVLRVARLGCFRFSAGTYLYVGSALGGLEGRLRRHARGGKLHWHIDFLLAAARPVGAWTVASSDRLECRIARALGTHLDVPVARFGASDCRCLGHLFFSPGSPDVGAILGTSIRSPVEYRRFNAGRRKQ